MYPYHSKRKKIRGWKRRIRQVHQWGEQINSPDLRRFELSGYTYDRCTLYPFYTLEKRQPPLWFYKKIISKLVAAYNNWTKIFSDLEISYDLHIWLYDPDYIRSEIICYKTEAAGKTIRLNSEVQTNEPFPYNKFADANYDLHQFNWSFATDDDVFFEHEFKDADFTAKDLLNNGYELNFKENGTRYYFKQLNIIWVGRK